MVQKETRKLERETIGIRECERKREGESVWEEVTEEAKCGERTRDG